MSRTEWILIVDDRPDAAERLAAVAIAAGYAAVVLANAASLRTCLAVVADTGGAVRLAFVSARLRSGEAAEAARTLRTAGKIPSFLACGDWSSPPERDDAAALFARLRVLDRLFPTAAGGLAA